MRHICLFVQSVQCPCAVRTGVRPIEEPGTLLIDQCSSFLVRRQAGSIKRVTAWKPDSTRWHDSQERESGACLVQAERIASRSRQPLRRAISFIRGYGAHLLSSQAASDTNLAAKVLPNIGEDTASAEKSSSAARTAAQSPAWGSRTPSTFHQAVSLAVPSARRTWLPLMD